MCPNKWTETKQSLICRRRRPFRLLCGPRPLNRSLSETCSMRGLQQRSLLGRWVYPHAKDLRRGVLARTRTRAVYHPGAGLGYQECLRGRTLDEPIRCRQVMYEDTVGAGRTCVAQFVLPFCRPAITPWSRPSMTRHRQTTLP